MRQLQLQSTLVSVGVNVQEMAQQAATDFAAAVRNVLTENDEVNVIFAGAESQQAFHQALVQRKDIDWHRINAFGVDDFYAPYIPVELSVCAQPERDLYQHVKIGSIHIPNYAASNAEAERVRYEQVIKDNPPHIACLGIGRSGHIAFNEPGCDFQDPQTVRVIDVCEASRWQLMDDPNFRDLGEIPSQGITVTIPALMQAQHTFIMVPYESKAAIIKKLFDSDEVSNELPMTILRQWPNAHLYLDNESSSQLSL